MKTIYFHGKPKGWYAWNGRRGGTIRASRWRARVDLLAMWGDRA